MELEGIQLLGNARVVAYGAATCEIREGFEGDDRAYDPANRGQPLDVWQLDFSIYNGSGKWLDHLIARYNIASEWPPCSSCSSWDGPSAATVGEQRSNGGTRPASSRRAAATWSSRGRR